LQVNARIKLLKSSIYSIKVSHSILNFNSKTTAADAARACVCVFSLSLYLSLLYFINDHQLLYLLFFYNPSENEIWLRRCVHEQTSRRYNARLLRFFINFNTKHPSKNRHFHKILKQILT